MKAGAIAGIILILSIVGAFGEEEGPPQYGYDNLPVTRFTCEGKLQGRYYADSETDCQMFHVCVRMSKKEIQDYRFLCPNGTVFDQEHLVCADYYQVACNANINAGPFGHIFEFLKLSASKDAALDFDRKVPSADPEYLGRNTLNDDFQVEEYNNNKLAAQGNSLQYSQNLAQKEIRFPTTTTRRTTTTRPPTTRYVQTTTARYTPPTTRYTVPTTTTTQAPTTTTAAPYYTESTAAVDESYSSQSTSDYQNNNQFNFHRETVVPQTFPTTTRRPDYFPGSNFGSSESTTYAPPSTTTLNYRDTSDFRYTTTRRPAVFQSTFRTSLEAVTTESPVYQQPQQTYQQQSSRFGDDYFRKIPTTEQSTTAKAQFLFYGDTLESKQTTYSPISQTTYSPISQTTYSPIARTTFRNKDYTTTQAYLQQGRSINSSPFIKSDRPKQFATKATPAPEYYTTTTTAAPFVNYYEPTKAPYSPSEYVEEQRYSETTAAPTTTTTTTTTARPIRRGGRRRVNPNRQRNNQNPRNFDPQIKYSRRVENERYNERESFAVQQKTEEIFDAEASVFRGPPKANNFYVEQARTPKEQDTTTTAATYVSTPVGPKKTVVTFGGENFGRRIRPGNANGKQNQFKQSEAEAIQAANIAEEEKPIESTSRPEGGRVIKRLRQKSTTEASTTIAYHVQPYNPKQAPLNPHPTPFKPNPAPFNANPAPLHSNSAPFHSNPSPANPNPTSFSPNPTSLNPTPFNPTTLRPARVSVRTKTVSGPIPGGVNNANNNGDKRRVVIKKLRPITSTEEPKLETAPAADYSGTSTTTYNNYNNNYNQDAVTALKIEEIQTTEKPYQQYSNKNLTATVGGFKVTVISKSSDQQTSTSNAQELTTSNPILPHHVFKPKAFFPKLDKKLIAGQPKQQQQVSVITSSRTSTSEKEEAPATKSPDYDYQYYNTDDETQFVAEQNSQDRLFGKRARNKAITP